MTKIPRFAFEKFPGAKPELTTAMKSVGEAMAIGRTFHESVQKAQAAIVSHGAGAVSTLSNAAASLQRLKEKQAGRAAQFEAANKLDEIQSGSDLDRRLASAGLLEGPGSGASILARVKARANPALAAPEGSSSRLAIAAPDPSRSTS